MKFKDAAIAKFCEKKKAYLMPTYSSYKNSLREFLKLSISCAAVGAVHCSSFQAFLLSVSDSEALQKVPLSVTLFFGLLLPSFPLYLLILSSIAVYCSLLQLSLMQHFEAQSCRPLHSYFFPFELSYEQCLHGCLAVCWQAVW